MVSVLVVEDSVVMRRLITDALSSDPNIEILGTAPNGEVALAKLATMSPDVVTMDIEMPVMDGLTTVRELRKSHPRLPVIMFSANSEAGAAATLEALAAGASDYVTKPSNVGSALAATKSIREQLIPRIHALAGRRRPPTGARAAGPAPSAPSRVRAARPSPPLRGAPTRAPLRNAPTPPPLRGAPAPPPLRGAPTLPPLRGASTTPDAGEPTPPLRRALTPPRGAPTLRGRVDLVAIGSSTGGPEALLQVLPLLPATFAVPIVIVQHMPKLFIQMFADRMNKACGLRVVEADDNSPLLPGTVYIAPGERHLEVVRRAGGVVTRLQTAPPENSCRPAVDVLFRSVGSTYGAAALGLVLTGMGQDGRIGAEVMRAAGAEIVAQDEATSVVWGMPGAVVGAGLAHHVLPLNEVPTYLISRVSGARETRRVAVTR